MQAADRCLVSYENQVIAWDDIWTLGGGGGASDNIGNRNVES